MKQTFTYRNNSFPLDLSSNGKLHHFVIGGKTYSVELVRAQEQRLDLLINGIPTSAYVSVEQAKRWVTFNGQTMLLVNSSGIGSVKPHSAHFADQLTARMPGLVRTVSVAEGDHVIKGQTLAVIEAMKMENKVTAPFDGRVKVVMIKTSQTVEREQLLFELTRSDEEENSSSTGID
ncbi:MAG TPA: biotin/lipoyl-containing protein [Anaerolineales bacterium]|jgi:biotin carboxyl carrier protein